MPSTVACPLLPSVRLYNSIIESSCGFLTIRARRSAPLATGRMEMGRM